MRRAVSISLLLHGSAIGAFLLLDGIYVANREQRPVWVTPAGEIKGETARAGEGKRHGRARKQVGVGGAAVSMKQVMEWGNRKPAYPYEAEVKGWQGNVLLRLRANARGEMEQVDLASSSGYPILDRAALEAAEGWRIPPEVTRNQAWLALLPVHFRLPN